jgi:hypothetical protein
MRIALSVALALVSVACASTPQGPAASLTIIGCPSTDGVAFFVDGRKVAKPSVVAAAKSAVGEGVAGAVILSEPSVRYGDLSDAAVRLRVAGFAPVDIIAMEPQDRSCARLLR